MLTNGRVPGNEVSTGVLPITTRIDWRGWLSKGLAGASLTVAMVARQSCMMVVRPSLATASSDERGYIFVVT